MDALDTYYKNSLLANLCSDYKGRWQVARHSKENLLRLSLNQQSIPHTATFAYQGKGVTREYIEKNFKDYINGYTIHDADNVKGYTYGLFVGNGDFMADKDVCSFMWFNGDIIVPQTKCVTLYVSNRSKANLVCDGYSHVRVYLFDESRITLDDVDEESSVIIYKYGRAASVEVGKFCLSDKVRMFDKELRL